MALRRQLLLVASLTLALPWAGCEYVKEMEASLRQGQEAALTATVQAVSARILTDPQLTVALANSVESLAQHGSDNVIYAHLQQSPVVLDGYDDEWRNSGIPWQSLSPQIKTAWGARDEQLFGYIQVADSDRQFFDPSLSHTSADHVVIGLSGQDALRFFSAAPGVLSVERHLGEGVWQREHRAVGVWNEQVSSYAIEVRLPLSWAQQGISIDAHDGASASSLESRELHALVQNERIYDEALSIFARPGIRLSLVAEDGWLLGRSGEVLFRHQIQERASFSHWLLRRILGQPDFPRLPDQEINGRLNGISSTASLNETAWYIWSDSLLGRVALPLELLGKQDSPRLWLVAEQTMDSLEALTSGAMGRLLWYTTVAMVLSGAALLAYASVLSWRIRRLSRAAQQAVDSDGRIRGNLPSGRSSDEIGDLARSFAALLQRLREYNEYLESLASKLSHELRTPLAIVRSSLDNLEQINDSGEQRVYIERASEGASRLSKLLNAMSAAARLEQTLQHSEFEEVDLAELLEHLAASYSSVYAPRNISYVVVGERPMRIRVAPELIAQLCDKLVENAADFTGDHGLIELHLSRHANELCLRVINTGPPLPESLQDRIFDSLTSSRAGDGQHLGLGLHVVKMIVRFHKGKVRAFNLAEEQKVVFEVVLPLA
ncbi:HAMP domain-containing protein [Saccharophagus sp. K07]|uniref:ATP-binding protein n=1 Tax=Saccharophagus sp. K07 TaxID=2283636 RepID=UPI001651BF00|nr:ATP-binding protein [Saccharophagus sp. K07]MBC6904664.1 HAMP domain-containing protein [Saccharophagus sp. K07]